jgi:hypothetical protein
MAMSDHFIDLAAANAVSFELRFSLQADASASLREQLGLDPDAPHALWDRYERSGVTHLLIVRLFTPGELESHLVFDYTLGGITLENDASRSSKRLAEALDRVIEGIDDASCSADFEYRAEQWSSIVSVPVSLDENRASMPFDTIMGYRFAKHANDELLYSVVLDRITAAQRDVISIHVAYGYAGGLPVSEFVESAYLRAVQIASQFVRNSGEGTVAKRRMD